MQMLRILWVLMLVGLAFRAGAEEYLEPEKAFRFSASMIGKSTIEVGFDIADGYYMYRDRFAFAAEGAQLGIPDLPQGKVKFDETFQKDVETYRGDLRIRIPVEVSASNSAVTLKVTSQGCADKGLCYPPQESVIRLTLSGGGGLLSAIRAARAEVSAPDYSAAAVTHVAPPSEMGRLESALKSGRLLAILPLFFVLGLGLAFTPCVLPMVPILSSIIMGESKRPTRTRGFLLSLSYSVGMVIVYTALGIGAGLLGEGLAANFQNPWILAGLAVLIALMSLAMFDVYQLQMPPAIQARLSEVSQRQSAGKFAGVFAMGAISALIVGPCVAAPLAATLLYISQTRDVLIGGSALFAMAVGMSVPLLLVGFSAGTLLPRAGAWMKQMKRLMGVLMLALASWIVSPVVPAWMTMLAWAVIGISYGTYMLWGGSTGKIAKAFGLFAAVLGLLQFAGVATGGNDPLAPLGHLRSGAEHSVAFQRVRSVAELDAALARSAGKTVLLDFYADWCVSCKEMEKRTFTDPRVSARMQQMVLLQADVTANNDNDKALLKRFRLFGPPGIIFFDKQGSEIEGAQVIGFQNADQFLKSLEFSMGR
jgi:thiol:disulfide interchange protein DsbD